MSATVSFTEFDVSEYWHKGHTGAGGLEDSDLVEKGLCRKVQTSEKEGVHMCVCQYVKQDTFSA